MEYQQCRPISSPRKVQITLDVPDEMEPNSDLEDLLSPGTNQTSSCSGKCSGDRISESSISTSILDEECDPKLIKLKMQDLELKCQMLEVENEKVNTELLAEKNVVAKLEKKLQFVKDNQEVFMRLKEAYINMKYNEAAGRKMIEIREKGIQTWEGILCKSCVETEEVRRSMNALLERYKELFVLSTNDMDQLVNTVKYLKDLVDRREKTWTSGLGRESKLHQNLAVMEKENEALRKMLEEKQKLMSEIGMERPTKLTNSVNTDEASDEQLKAEINQMKKIIVKFEKRFRDSFEGNYYAKTTSPLNDKEQRMVHRLMSRYRLKSQRRTASERSRSLSSHRSTRTESPGVRSSRQKSVRPPSSRNSARTDLLDVNKKTDKALKMMDYLFEN